MVLVLKHWKSRSSPGIKAGGHRDINPFTVSKTPLPGHPRAAAFSSLDQTSKDNGTAGWSSPVARQAHNLKVVGSNPTPATTGVTLAAPAPVAWGCFRFLAPPLAASSVNSSIR